MTDSEPKKCGCLCHITLDGRIQCCGCDKPITESTCDKDSTKCDICKREICIGHPLADFLLKDADKETLSLCPHGIPTKFNNCLNCNKVFEIQAINTLNDRLDKLEELERTTTNKSRWQLEIESRLDKLEKDDDKAIEALERLDKLESELKSSNKELCRVVYNISVIENVVNTMLVSKGIDQDKISKDAKIPHKCPVCMGCGLDIFKEDIINPECKSCKGKGILWG